MAEEEKNIEGVENAVEDVVKEAEVIEEIAADIKAEAKEEAASRQERFEETKAEAKEKFEEAKAGAKEKFEEAKEKATEAAEKFKAKVEEAKAAAEADDDDVYDEEDIKKNKVMAVLAYLGILCLIPLFAAKDSRFARFHTNQGVLLFAASIICSILTYVPIVKWFVWILNLVIFVFAIMGIVYAVKGECKELPIIGKYRVIK